MPSRVAAVIAAAGVGERFNAAGNSGPPKALRLLRGRSLLEHSLDALTPLADVLVVAVPAGHVSAVQSDLSARNADITVLAGGASRQQSVHVALAELDTGVEFVLVHDAARALVPPEVATRVLDALRGGAQAVVPVVAAVDSLRRVDADGSSAVVDRSEIRAVQTPQGFRRDVLVRAHGEIDYFDAADDASLVERTGVPVTLVPGSELAFKITRLQDMVLAEALLAAVHQTAAATRALPPQP